MSEEITQWEYKRTNELPEKELNDLGKDGWELAGVSAGYQGATKGYVLKRPKKNQSLDYDYSR